VIAAAADSKPQGVWDIDEDGYIINEVQIKSKKFFSVVELLGPNCQYKNAFNGGTMTHSFLNVFDYHRYHFPVSGTIKEVDIVAGEYAVGGEVKWNATNKTYDLYCDEPSWQSIETRGRIVLEIPSNGLVAILPIGMMPVTSINWENNIKVGNEVKKGDMLGYFLFGGSDIVILFQEGYQFNLTVPKDGSGYEHQYQGEELGRISH
jgi:phosphatidylserine decarboxylase